VQRCGGGVRTIIDAEEKGMRIKKEKKEGE